MENIKHIVCYSGGHSSAIVAIEVVKKYGKENVILLNHNIIGTSENEDVKRFKKEIAEYLDMDITYANMKDWDKKDQFDVCIDAKAFKTRTAPALCTSRLKTQPFIKYLNDNFPNKNCICYYGFDKAEDNRINRRTGIMEEMGYKTVYPLATWDILINDTNNINIKPPMQYELFKHANCIGCLKGGSQHWYVVFCTRRDIWQKAKDAENKIGYSIIKGHYLKDLECKFELMQKLEIKPTEHIQHQTFWAMVRKKIRDNKLEDISNCETSCLCS